MCGLRVKTHKVPSVVMGSLSRGDLVVRFRLDGVDEVDEFDCILDEEYWHVVADNVPAMVFSCWVTNRNLYHNLTHLPSSVYNLTANPLGSLTVSAEPLEPLTVENLTYAGVIRLVSVRMLAVVKPLSGVCSLNSPNAPAPRA